MRSKAERDKVRREAAEIEQLAGDIRQVVLDHVNARLTANEDVTGHVVLLALALNLSGMLDSFDEEARVEHEDLLTTHMEEAPAFWEMYGGYFRDTGLGLAR